MTDRQSQELDKYLEGRSRLSAQYGLLGADEPPPELDAEVLAEARRAVAPPRRRRPAGWLLPAALAATVLLSFSLLLRMGGLPAPGRPPVEEPAGPPVGVSLPAPAAVPALPLAPQPVRPPAPVPVAGDQASPVGAPAQSTVTRTAEATAAAAGETRRDATESLADVQLQVAAAAPAPATPPFGPTPAFAQVIEAIRARVTAAAAQAARPQAATVPASDPDGILREILRRYEAGDAAGARAAFEQFRREHPQHPLSIRFATVAGSP